MDPGAFIPANPFFFFFYKPVSCLLQHHAEAVTAEVAAAVDLPIPGGHHLQNVLATDIALERPLLVTGACRPSLFLVA